MRNESLYRQWQILHSIYNNRVNGISKKELSDIYNVSKKTIERDIRNLSTSGFPIYDEQDKCRNNQVFYYMDRKYTIPEIRLSDLENYVMFIIMKVSYPFKGYFDRPLQDCFDKIFAQANPEFRKFAYKFTDLILPDSSNVINLNRENHISFVTIMEAIFKNRKISFKHKGVHSKTSQEYTISPLAIKLHNNNFYFAAYLKEKQRIRIFAINQISDIKLVKEFQDNVKFLPNKFFEEAYGISEGEPFKVRLLFKQEAVQTISERIWNVNQIMIPQKNGDLILEMHAKSMIEIVSLVLSYQDKVEVLEPDELKMEVQNTLKKISYIYDVKAIEKF